MERTSIPEIEIIEKGEGYCVCVKPKGISSQGEGEGDMPVLLARALGVERVFPVHRLDRETAGLMVFATNEKAAAELSRQITAGEMVKEYEATLLGALPDDEGELVDLLFYDRKKGRSFVVNRERKGVKEARLSYKVIERTADTTKVRVHLYTGRTHQIRVQFSSRGYPIKGDGRYGGGGGEMQLTSVYLSFKKPDGGEIFSSSFEKEEARKL